MTVLMLADPIVVAAAAEAPQAFTVGIAVVALIIAAFGLALALDVARIATRLAARNRSRLDAGEEFPQHVATSSTTIRVAGVLAAIVVGGAAVMLLAS